MRRVLVLVLLASTLAGANPTVQLSKPERARLNQLLAQRKSRYHFGSVEFDKRNGRLLLALAEESKDPYEVSAALQACARLYTSTPEGRATSNGKSYQRIPIDDECRVVTRRLLAHPNSQVRETAAHLAGECIRSSPGDTSFYPLLKAAMKQEPDGNRRANILFSLFYCLSPDPGAAELLLIGLNDPHSNVLSKALSVVGHHFHKGVDYGPAYRNRVRPIVERSLRRREPDLRCQALSCLLDMTPPERRLQVLDEPLRRFLKDPNGAVVARGLGVVAELHATEMIGLLEPLLDDHRSTRLEAVSVEDEQNKQSFGDATPVQHFALDCLQELSDQGFSYAYHHQPSPNRDLAAEVQRARQWLKAHRQ